MADKTDEFATFVYKRNATQHFKTMPEINGMKCVAMHSVDLSQQKDDAYSLLAKIANGDFDFLEVESVALDFFKERNHGETYQTFIEQ